MITQPSIEDTFVGQTDPVANVSDVAAGSELVAAAGQVARLGRCSTDYDRLSDADALAGQRTLARLQHELDTRKAWMAKTLAQRSRWELGQEGLAKKHGYLSPEDLIQNLTGATKADTRKLVDVGRMLAETEAADAQQAAADAEAEAEAARRLLDQADPGSDGRHGPDLDGSDPDGFDPSGTDPSGTGTDRFSTLTLPPVPAPWHAPIARALSDGTLSIDAAHALRKGLGDIDTVVTGPVLTEALDRLLADAPTMNADQLLKAARQTRDSLDEAGIRVREQKAWDDRYLRIWTLDTGQVRVDGLFPPEQGEFIKATFDSLTSPRRGGVRFVDTDRAAWARRVQNDPRTTGQITCDGFIDLLRAGTTINPNEMLGGRRPAVQILTTVTPATPDRPVTAADILINPPGLAGQVGHGSIEGNTAPVSAETIERLICDSGTVDIRFDDHNRPLDVGHEQRLFTRAQRRALAARDGGCTWPGCDRPPSFTEAHHIDHWQRDHGRTDINHGILLCRTHHLLLHNQRWQIFENHGRYWLRPPATIDPGQTLIEMTGRAQGLLPKPAAAWHASAPPRT
ncbi:HNH endonuclease signature motif containing protein [Cryobacterium arcticum]|uniref:HNH nuclease domain-containing protein n=1 Tax=Cryobacterium arcticum TaxID=670052 RepID=A0A317ZRK9_9MICO|nr:HNH endonuclease signature motif containing protein [Cryobacterium arcticum]PXA67394.1 hypothetical protein CTB96_11690 [Cryobacterium arcticum]